MLRPLCSRQAASPSFLSTSQSLKHRLLCTSSRSFQSNSLSSRQHPRSWVTDTKTPLLTSIQRRYYAEKIIKVPQMAESISEGTLKQWSKKEGDYAEQDEEIGTIETDKIDVSINAPVSGTITQLIAKEEDTVEVGQEIGKMDDSGKPSEGGKQESSSKQEESKQEESKPDTGKDKSDQPQQQSQQEPRMAVQNEQEGETKQKTEKPPPKPSDSKSATEETQQPAPRAQPKQEPKKEQPKKEQQQQQQQSSKAQSASTSEAPAGARDERRVKMNRMRLRIAERLKQSQNTAASLTTFQKVDMSALMEFRKLYKDDILKKTGVKLGFMGAFARASILAMREVPTVNASIEGPGGGDTIVYRDYVDVSVAVATEKGLVTPVVRNAESMDIIGIESAITELGKKARDNKLTIEDMAGGTYTISNGGVFGSLFGTPIINLPQTAVLGLHAINDEVVPINGKFEARPIMYLALTYDHRLLDGREAVTFLVKIKQYIEDPRRMLLGH